LLTLIPSKPTLATKASGKAKAQAIHSGISMPSSNSIKITYDIPFLSGQHQASASNIGTKFKIRKDGRTSPLQSAGET
jgi:hypothetical protein